MKTVIICQARMTSTRLPGKVLLKILGKPLLEYQIERMKRVTLADEIIIATTLNNTDDPIVSLSEKLKISYSRGPEEDVLKRYYLAAAECKADLIIRVTSDCPLLDPGIIDQTIKYYKNNDFDYVSNMLTRSYPRGLDCEVFSMEALTMAHNEAYQKSDREHVTPYIYNNPDKFKISGIESDTDYSHHRWTVDTKDDFLLIKTIYEKILSEKEDFTWLDCIELMKKYPKLQEINAHIEQKKI